jgi:hypothetical protein
VTRYAQTNDRLADEHSDEHSDEHACIQLSGLVLLCKSWSVLILGQTSWCTCICDNFGFALIIAYVCVCVCFFFVLFLGLLKFSVGEIPSEACQAEPNVAN